jgi:RNA polymerase sigma-70 factor (ECF subfamily)
VALKEIRLARDYWLLDMNQNGAFEELMRECGPMIRRIAASYEADRELARDLAQEIFLAVWRALPTFRGESSLRSFAARIAHNRAVTHVARCAQLPNLVELPGDLPSPELQLEAMVIEHDRRVRALAAVQQLPLAYHQVATLMLEGFTLTEIAQALSLTVNAVSIRASRARAMLHSMLGE